LLYQVLAGFVARCAGARQEKPPFIFTEHTAFVITIDPGEYHYYGRGPHRNRAVVKAGPERDQLFVPAGYAWHKSERHARTIPCEESRFNNYQFLRRCDYIEESMGSSKPAK
jgi:hypothetical protein